VLNVEARRLVRAQVAQRELRPKSSRRRDVRSAGDEPGSRTGRTRPGTKPRAAGPAERLSCRTACGWTATPSTGPG